MNLPFAFRLSSPLPPSRECQTICPFSRLVLAIFSGDASAAAHTRISAKFPTLWHSTDWLFLTLPEGLMRVSNGPNGRLKEALWTGVSGSLALSLGLFGRVSVALWYGRLAFMGRWQWFSGLFRSLPRAGWSVSDESFLSRKSSVWRFETQCEPARGQRESGRSWSGGA